MRHSTIDHAPDHIRTLIERERRADGGTGQVRRSFGFSATEFRDAGPAAECVSCGEEHPMMLFTGCASVFDVGYEMYGGAPHGWIEFVDSGAGDKTLAERPDVQFLINHRDMPLARTKSSTLRLSVSTGLDVSADLTPCDPDVQRLRPKLARRDMDEMSFGFLVVRQEWNDDYTERHIKEFSLQKGDVSVVNYGANDSTWANDLRSAADLLAELTDVDPDRLVAELRDASGGDPLGALMAAQSAITAAIRAVRTPADTAPVARDLASALYL